MAPDANAFRRRGRPAVGGRGGPGAGAGPGGRASASSHGSSQASAALIRECRVLIDLKSELDPDGTLNWVAPTPLASWDRIGSTATDAVTRIDFRTSVKTRLEGSIPAGLGSLPNQEFL